MEERKLDALLVIGKQLVELNKNIASRFPEKDSMGNLIDDGWDDDIDDDDEDEDNGVTKEWLKEQGRPRRQRLRKHKKSE